MGTRTTWRPAVVGAFLFLAGVLTSPGEGRAAIPAYDGGDNVTSVTPPGRSPHVFQYDANGLLTVYDPPDAGGITADHVVHTYNADKQQTKTLLPGNVAIDFTYDATTGRLTTVTLPRGPTSLTYDSSTGDLATVTTPEGNGLGFSYDGALLTQTSWSGSAVAGTVSRAYDDDFRLVSRDVSGDAIAFTYDDGLLTSAGDLTLARNPQTGLLDGTTLGGVDDAWTPDLYGDAASYSAGYGASELYAWTAVRDRNERIVSKTETVGGTTTLYDYHYDSSDRLIQVDVDGVAVRTYGYDANGNRTTFADGNGTITGTHDAQDKLTSYGGLAYTYDASGNLRTRDDGTNTTTYSYDAVENLSEVDLPDGTVVTYAARSDR